MKKIYFFLLLGLFSSVNMKGQPGELFSTLSFRHILDNPAAMGIDGRNHIYFGGYKKWFGLTDAPQTYFVSTSHRFILPSLGLGATLVYDRAGLLTHTRFNLNASIHLNPGSLHRISIGASARYQNIGFGLPNVDDPYLSDQPSASNINIGLGLNYYHPFGNSSFFNFQVVMPQFPATMELTRAQGTEPLAYNFVNELILQGNLKYSLSNGNYFTPSLRYQAQLSDAAVKKTQILDLGLGLSFLEGVLDVRLGLRTGKASMIYGGVGYQFGGGSNAHVFFEPGGPLGSSAAFDAELAFGEGGEIEKKKKTVCFNDISCLQSRLNEIDPRKVFKVMVNADSGTDFTFVTFEFPERVNAYLNYFKHEDFLRDIPLPRLLGLLENLNLTDILKNKSEIVQITYRAKVANDLNSYSFEDYQGEDIVMEYWQAGAPQKRERITQGQQLNEAQLAAVKIHFLSGEIKNRIPSLANTITRKEVVQDASLDDNRVMEIVLVIR